MEAADVVRSLYRGLLERDPGPRECEHWTSTLAEGMPLEEVVREFAWSEERSELVSRRSRSLPAPGREGPSLTILDIGAQALQGEEDVYKPLLEGGHCRVIGFEPIEETHAERLERNPDWVMLPHFAGDGRRRTFYRARWGPASSLYEPNFEAISVFEGLAEECAVADVSEVDTVRLDDVVTERVDLMKLDVQGAELDVLVGAQRLLGDVLVVHLEVEFLPIYKGVPLFDSLHSFLTDRGFELFDFSRLVRYAYAAIPGAREHLVWGDAVYVPRPSRIEGLDMAAAKRLSRIMRDAYGAVGFSRWLLESSRRTAP